MSSKNIKNRRLKWSVILKLNSFPFLSEFKNPFKNTLDGVDIPIMSYWASFLLVLIIKEVLRWVLYKHSAHREFRYKQVYSTITDIFNNYNMGTGIMNCCRYEQVETSEQVEFALLSKVGSIF